MSDMIKDEPSAAGLAGLRLAGGILRLLIEKGLITEEDAERMISTVVEETDKLPFKLARTAGDNISLLAKSSFLRKN